MAQSAKISTRLLPASRGAALVAFLVVTGCEPAAVRWSDTVPQPSSAPSPLAHPPFVAIDSTMRDGAPEAEFLLVQDLMREAGAATLLTQTLLSMPEARDSVREASPLPAMASMSVGTPTLTTLGNEDAPQDSARCVRSLRVALAPARGRVAVWWSSRSKSRAWLVAAWRDTVAAEGRLGPWRGPIVIDSLDQGPADARAAERGAAGCMRPAPSLTVDDILGYVHVAYVVVGPEGPGVFYAHQMDPRSAFEPPVAIVYGDQLGSARVAASGNLVAVAYEDPNSGVRSRIGLAVSRTAGHLFEERLIASGTTTTARDPYVTVRGRAIVEGWSEVPSGDGEPVFRLRRAVVR